MTCSDFLQELSEYLDGSVDASLQQELEQHLTRCRKCHVVCNTTRKTIEIYRQNEIYELPNDLRTRLQNAILAKCRSKE